MGESCASSFNGPGSGSSDPASGKYAAYSWVICVVFMAGAVTVSNLGMNLQKLALVKSQELNEEDTSYTSDRRKWRICWVAGMICIVLGACGDTGALNFGAQSVVAPLSSLTLVANAIIARCMHGEELSRRDVFATLLIISGCILSVAFAEHKDTLYCSDFIFEQFSEAANIAYILLITLAVAGGMAATRWIERVETELGTSSELYQKWFALHRFSYATIAGVVGAQSVLAMKIFIEIFTNSATGGKLFLAYWQTYPLIIMLALCVAMQIYWLNLGLARFAALYNVPVFQCFWMLFGVIGGGVFFREFSRFDPLQATMFPIGVLLCIGGVALLSQRGVDEEKGGAEEGDSLESGDSTESSPLVSSGSSSASSTDYSAMSDDAPLELPEIDVVADAGPLSIGMYPEIVKINHPQFPKVQCMVKVWRVRDLPMGPDGQPGQMQQQGVAPGMMLVGINSESILRQRNTWREVLVRLQTTVRPMLLTFRDISEAHSKQAAPSGAASGQAMPSLTSATPGQRTSSQTLYTPQPGFAPFAHAGQIRLSADRRRRTAPQSVPTRRQHTRRVRSGTAVDVLDSHTRLRMRPLVGSTLTVFHAPSSLRIDTFDRQSSSQNMTADMYTHPVAEFADQITRGLPPVLDTVLDVFSRRTSTHGSLAGPLPPITRGRSSSASALDTRFNQEGRKAAGAGAGANAGAGGSSSAHNAAAAPADPADVMSPYNTWHAESASNRSLSTSAPTAAFVGPKPSTSDGQPTQGEVVFE